MAYYLRLVISSIVMLSQNDRLRMTESSFDAQMKNKMGHFFKGAFVKQTI